MFEILRKFHQFDLLRCYHRPSSSQLFAILSAILLVIHLESRSASPFWLLHKVGLSREDKQENDLHVDQAPFLNNAEIFVFQSFSFCQKRAS